MLSDDDVLAYIYITCHLLYQGLRWIFMQFHCEGHPILANWLWPQPKSVWCKSMQHGIDWASVRNSLWYRKCTSRLYAIKAFLGIFKDFLSFFISRSSLEKYPTFKLCKDDNVIKLLYIKLRCWLFDDTFR